jgi:hypothetical protein
MTMCGVVALLILLHNPLPALVGVGIVVCGLPLRQYLLIRPSTGVIVSHPFSKER